MRNLIFLFFTILFSTQSPASNLSFDLEYFSYEDIKEFSQLAKVGYGDKGIMKDMEKLGWEFKPISKNGYECTNGPLVVYSFRGTDDYITAWADLQAAQKPTTNLFPGGITGAPQSMIHNGIWNYYNSFRAIASPNKLDDDQLLVFAGHSLGGAVANLSALDFINKFKLHPQNYPQNFCSIFTLGAPAIMGSGLQGYLDSYFPGSSHVRVGFDNDPVVNFTSGATGDSLNLCTHSTDDCVFRHAGTPLVLDGGVVPSHPCSEYTRAIATRPNSTNDLWPEFSLLHFLNETDAEKFKHQVYSNCRGAIPDFLKSQYKGIDPVCSLFSYPDPLLTLIKKYQGWRFFTSNGSCTLDNFRFVFTSIRYLDERTFGKTHQRTYKILEEVINQNELPEISYTGPMGVMAKEVDEKDLDLYMSLAKVFFEKYHSSKSIITHFEDTIMYSNNSSLAERLGDLIYDFQDLPKRYKIMSEKIDLCLGINMKTLLKSKDNFYEWIVKNIIFNCQGDILYQTNYEKYFSISYAIKYEKDMFDKNVSRLRSGGSLSGDEIDKVGRILSDLGYPSYYFITSNSHKKIEVLRITDSFDNFLSKLNSNPEAKKYFDRFVNSFKDKPGELDVLAESYEKYECEAVNKWFRNLKAYVLQNQR